MTPALHAILTTSLVLTPSVAFAQVTETGFLDRTLTLENRDYAYQVYVPRNYDDTKEWPVILFLHGADENGDEGLKQTDVGLGSAIRFHPERWPAIVVFPQGPADEALSWTNTSSQIAMTALEAALEEFNTDESRIYLTGISMGGEGSWYLGYEHPERFAAIVPICGFVENPFEMTSFVPTSDAGSYTNLAERIKDIPIWIFHGEVDNVVPVEESRHMAVALAAVGADVRYTELSGVEHNAWDPAYFDEALPTWLFEQQKRP